MNYYRKTVNNTVNDIKLKMQIGALTVKITENINKINDLLEVDKNIKKDIVDNSNNIVSMDESIYIIIPKCACVYVCVCVCVCARFIRKRLMVMT